MIQRTKQTSTRPHLLHPPATSDAGLFAQMRPHSCRSVQHRTLLALLFLLALPFVFAELPSIDTLSPIANAQAAKRKKRRRPSRRRKRRIRRSRRAKSPKVRQATKAQAGFEKGWHSVNPSTPRLHVDLTSLAHHRSSWTLTSFVWGHPQGGDIVLWADGKKIRRFQTKSKRPRAKQFKARLPQGTRHAWLEPTSGKTLVFGLVVEGGHGVVIDRLGISGAEMQHWQRIDPRIIQAHLRARRPDLWVMMFGTNEAYNKELNPARYQRQITQLLQHFKRGAPTASCLMVAPMDIGGRWSRHYRLRRNLVWIRKVQKQVAQRMGCAYLDQLQMMGGPSGMWRWSKFRPRWAYRDKVHLTKKGYTFQAQMLDAVLFQASGLRQRAPYHNPIMMPAWRKPSLQWPKKLASFHNKLRRFAAQPKGKLRIMMLGDSHLSIGRTDYVLRRLWQSRLGNGGPGWLQPASVQMSVTSIGGARLFWTGSWRFSSVLRPSNPPWSQAWMGIGGRSFLADVPHSRKIAKRYAMIYPGLHGIGGGLIRPGRAPLLIDRARGKLIQLRKQSRVSAIWRRPTRRWSFAPWRWAKDIWHDPSGTYIRCFDNRLGSCTARFEHNKLSKPKEGEKVVPRIASALRAKNTQGWWAKAFPGKRSLTIYTPGRKGRWRRRALLVRRPIKDIIAVRGDLWVLTRSKPHLTRYHAPRWKAEVVEKHTIYKPHHLGKMGRYLLVTQESGRFLWRYNLQNQREIGPLQLQTRATDILSLPGKQQALLYGKSRHIQIFGLKRGRPHWHPQATMSMPGPVRSLQADRPNRTLWIFTAQPEAVWRMRAPLSSAASTPHANTPAVASKNKSSRRKRRRQKRRRRTRHIRSSH